MAKAKDGNGKKPKRGNTGINWDAFDRLVRDIEMEKAEGDASRMGLASSYKEAEEQGFHRAAMKLSIKLKNMEALKRADFLRGFDLYRDHLELDAQGDMLGDEDAERTAAEAARAAGGVAGNA